MKDTLLKEMAQITKEKVLIIPFYPSLEKQTIEARKKEVFLYVSSGSPHKNHLNLIEAFCKFYDLNKKGELHLTIDSDFKALIDLVRERLKEGYPIINHGFLQRDLLGAIYSKATFSIYPSLSESFGLGIIEAMENGCEVIGADLPYTYAVCNPSIIFNPLDINDIKRAIQDSQREDIKKTEQLAFNQIDDLILLLKT